MCANIFANHLWYYGDQHYEITVGPSRAAGMEACATATAHGVLGRDISKYVYTDMWAGPPNSAGVCDIEEYGAGLIRTETQRARKGNQKICHTLFDEVLVMFKKDPESAKGDTIEVAMPLGLYTTCEVSAPCGLCSRDGIVGYIDFTPSHFFHRVGVY